MKELDQILSAWPESAGGILATVVQVSGSAYRRPGARMLILPDGRRVGSVSGGCLEGDLTRKAWWLTEHGRPVLRTYDTSSEEDAVWEFGLGCNGVIDVLLERVDAPETAQAMRFLARHRGCRQTARLATVIRGNSVGARVLLEDDRSWSGSLSGSKLVPALIPLLRNLQSNQVVVLNDTEVFLERVDPPQPLIIFGAGHDTLPLVAIGKELGWHVTVADGRRLYATAERFPAADRVVVIGPDKYTTDVEIPAEAAVVLMTHNYPQDQALLQELLQRPLRYLGILGPRLRAERMFQELHTELPNHLYAPVGLDIGAGSPETIALAIAAEISAALSGRPGAMLRNRVGPIYDHPVTPFVRLRPTACEVSF